MIDFKELYTGKLWCQTPPYRVIASTQDKNLAGTGTNALPHLAFTERLPVGKGLEPKDIDTRDGPFADSAA